ncbi:MAG: hypothetical protein AAGA25_07730 [Planctomycetota bacterium]
MESIGPTAGRVVTLDKEGLIAIDLPCSSCDYLLRAQPPDGSCPECGTSIQETLKASNIRLLPLDWLRRIQAGSVCLAVSIPLLLLFGIGLFIWLLGVLTLCIEPPKNRPEFKRMQRLIATSGVGAAVCIIAVFPLSDVYFDSWLLELHLGVFVLLIGFHVAAVLRYAAHVCGLSHWGMLKHLANGLMWLVLILCGLAAGWTALLEISIEYALSGSTPGWVEYVLAYVGMFIGLGLIAFLITAFVFWITLAIRMRRIRSEAKSLHHDAKSFAA